MAAMPHPKAVAVNNKRKRTENKIGEKNSDPKHLTDPVRCDILEKLENDVKKIKDDKVQTKEDKTDYQAPAVTVMTHTGWLKKDTNLTGKLLDVFFRANFDPQGNVGFFTSKPQGSDGKAPTVMQKTKFYWQRNS